MQPMKPDQKRSILENSPQAQPGDIQEYERLLSLRFAEDPDMQAAAAPASGKASLENTAGREVRIQQLHRKLFGQVAVEHESAPDDEEQSETGNKAHG